MLPFVKDKVRTHAENRLKICLLCKKKRKSMTRLSPAIIENLRNKTNYDPKDERLPAAICNTCKIKFYKQLKSELSVTLPDYTEFTISTKRFGKCDCTLCELVLDDSDFNFTKKVKTTKYDKVKRLQKKTYKHQNKEANVKQTEIINEIKNSLTVKEQQQLVSRLIKDQNGASTNRQLKFSQHRGKALRVDINPAKRKSMPKISASEVSNIQTNYSLTSNQVIGITRDLRVGAKSRKLFEPYLINKLREFNHALDQYFEIHEIDFLREKGNQKHFSKEPFIICNNISGLCQFVQEKREQGHIHLKFGIDGGGGFLKITLSLQNVIQRSNRTLRQKYNDGIASKKFSDAGVKKLILVGVVPCAQENYPNVSTLWKLLKINDFKGTIATDMKLANILAGLMGHSSCNPCAYCTATKDYLGKCGEYRSIGSCSKNYHDWLNAGGSKQRAKNYMNCTNLPVFEGEADDEIIDFLPPPELHLMTGVVNKLYDCMLQEFHSDALKWAALCNVQRTASCGRFSFAGNASKTLLEKVDILRSFCEIGCVKYVQCFQDFQRVVKSCFSNELNDDYKNNIEKFQRSYLDLNISITPKVHAVFFHVSHFCEKTNRGLGFYSEQAVESAHYDFKMTWNKYQVPRNHPQYAAQLLKAVCEYNSRHI